MPRLRQALDHEAALFTVIALAVTASRAPFISYSCGADPDAWRIVAAARNLARFSEYSVSRFPGFPLVEIAYAPVAAHPLWMSGITAAVSGIAAGALAVMMRDLGLRGARLGALAFAATPVVYVNSTSTMDYVWSLAFVLLGFMALIKARATLAGVALGLAVGCRASAVLMLAPACAFVVMTIQPRDLRQAVRRLGPTVAWALVVAAACYLPVWLRYGVGMLHYYPQDVGRRVALQRGTLGVWGALGTGALGLAAALAFTHVRRMRPDGSTLWSDPKHRAAFVMAATAILTVGALYAWAPHEAGYLMPVVPFVIMTIAVLLPARSALAIYVLLMLSPFIDVSAGGVSEGMAQTDLREKLRYAEEAKAILAQGRDLHAKSLVHAGRWFPAVAVLLSAETRQLPLPDGGIGAHAVTDGTTTYMVRDRSRPGRAQVLPLGVVDVYTAGVAEGSMRLVREPVRSHAAQ